MPDTREYGLRIHHPAEDHPRIIPCDGPIAMQALIDDLWIDGVTAIEPITRIVPDWETADAGLPATIRVLAEAHLDDEIDAPTVRRRLARLLRVDPDVLFTAWCELREAIEEYRRADDGPVDWSQVPPELQDREALVRHRGRVAIRAVNRVIETARKETAR